MTTLRQPASLLFATAMLLGSVSAVSAQSPDARWLPFVGCWEAVGSDQESGILCFEPSNGGVALSNYAGGEVVSTEQLVADSQQRSVEAEGCEGWESVQFSQDGRRAFTRTEFDCGTDQPRTGTGVMAFIAPNMWVDVRALDVDGEPVAWMQEYLLVGIDRLAEEGVTDPAAELRFAVRSARMAAAAPIDLTDVQEGAAHVDDRALETWIVAQGDRFDPSASDLLTLADAGVSEAVIDAVVAVSYPDDFVVEADGMIEEAERAPRPTSYRGYMAYSPWSVGPWGRRPAYGYGVYGYSPYGYNPFLYSGYGYSGYGYGYYGGYGYGYGGSRPGTVIIQRRSSGNGGTASPQGYRRGGTASGGGSARPRGAGQPAYSGPNRSSGSAGSSGSGSRPARTAKPRRRTGGDSGGSASASRPASRPAPAARTAKPRRRTGG